MTVQPSIPEVSYNKDLPVMDREQIDMLLMVEDDEDPTSLLRELFTLFEGEGREKMELLHQACSSDDVGELRKIVHFVAGSAGNLGLARLCAFYRAVEAALDRGELVELSHCEEPVREAFQAACEGFRKEFDL